MFAFHSGEGVWTAPEWLPGANAITLHLHASCLHYGGSVFEGLKGWRCQCCAAVVLRVPLSRVFVRPLGVKSTETSTHNERGQGPTEHVNTQRRGQGPTQTNDDDDRRHQATHRVGFGTTAGRKQGDFDTPSKYPIERINVITISLLLIGSDCIICS